METTQIIFDMEFTELSKKAEIISLACTAENGRWFIGEFSDYNSAVNPFVKENVIPQLFCSKLKAGDKHPDNGLISITPFDVNAGNHFEEQKDQRPKFCYAYGTKDFIRQHLIDYLKSARKDPDEIVEFVTDVGQFDIVLMTDLLSGGKTSFEMPDYISPAYHDINYDIARYYEESTGRSFPDHEAFNVSRAELYKELSPDWPLWKEWNGNAHDAMWDALISANIYHNLVHKRRSNGKQV